MLCLGLRRTMVGGSVTAMLAGTCFGCGDDSAVVAAGTTGGTDAGTMSATAPSTSITPTGGEAASDGSTSATQTGGPTGSSTQAGTGSSSGEPNTDPVAQDDFYLTNTLEKSLIVAADGVLANDEDPDGDTVVVAAFDPVSLAGGIVAGGEDGSFSYTAPAGYWGEDSFGYELGDGNGGSATAIVRIMVAPAAQSLAEITTASQGFRITGVGGEAAGTSVAGGGDVNGDGFADLVVGAPDAGGAERGVAYVVFGKADAAEVASSDIAAGIGGFAIVGDVLQNDTGLSVEIAGDVNGDGLADILVGAPQEGATGFGAAYVVYGRAETTAVALADIAAGSNTGFMIGDAVSGGPTLGQSVAAAGDVNGDGRADILVGAPELGLAERGLAAVVLGKDDSAAVDVANLGTGGYIVAGVAASGHMGYAVAGIGDFNGDGLQDFAIGGPDGGAGTAAIVLGKTDTNDLDLADLMAGLGGLVLNGAQVSDAVGFSVQGAGDVNGDARSDLIVGAVGVEVDGGAATGRAFVVYGKNNTNPVLISALEQGTAGFILDGESQFDFAGWSVAGAGDINGDGYADLVVATPGVDVPAFSAGRTYVLYGRGDDDSSLQLGATRDAVLGFSFDGEGNSADSGFSVDAAGDVNGDGYGDLVIGSPGVGGDSGRVYVAFGGNFTASAQLGATSGADVIEASSVAQSLVAGAGDDVLTTFGGPTDVVRGGQGDDVINLTDVAFFRIDGGLGSDTLALPGSGQGLNLTNYLETALCGIERIDLTGVGDNSLFMELRDLRALSQESRVLIVTGDTGDQLVIDLEGAGFVDLGSDGTMTTLTNGVLAVVVSDEVEVFATL